MICTISSWCKNRRMHALHIDSNPQCVNKQFMLLHWFIWISLPWLYVWVRSSRFGSFDQGSERIFHLIIYLMQWSTFFFFFSLSLSSKKFFFYFYFFSTITHDAHFLDYIWQFYSACKGSFFFLLFIERNFSNLQLNIDDYYSSKVFLVVVNDLSGCYFSVCLRRFLLRFLSLIFFLPDVICFVARWGKRTLFSSSSTITDRFH